MIAQKLHFVPNIPEFQHSNWGEAPNLLKSIEYLNFRHFRQFRHFRHSVQFPNPIDY